MKIIFITLFEFYAFFGTPAAQSILIDNLVQKISNAGSKGINIDLEEARLSTAYLSPFVAFMHPLNSSLRSVIPDSQLSIDLQGTYASPLIDSFTGATVPFAVVVNSSIITLPFHMDGMTVKTGYKALNTCCSGAYIAKAKNSGNWNNPQIWQYGAIPEATDSVEIMPGDTVTVNISAQVQNIRIDTTAVLIINDTDVDFTIGTMAVKSNRVINNGTLQISAGHMSIFGNITNSISSTFNLTGGKLMIDGNTGNDTTSIADGENLFTVNSNPDNFSFTGDTLQIINPPLGANSQSIQCPYNFGAGTVLMFGDGSSTIASNNTNGFGGDLLPAQIGKLVLHAATLGNNRIFKNTAPLIIKMKCEVLSGNLVQGDLLVVDGN